MVAAEAVRSVSTFCRRPRGRALAYTRALHATAFAVFIITFGTPKNGHPKQEYAEQKGGEDSSEVHTNILPEIGCGTHRNRRATLVLPKVDVKGL